MNWMYQDRVDVKMSVPVEAKTRRDTPDPDLDPAHAPDLDRDPEVATLYALYRDDVLRFCLAKLGNYDDAADIVQEAFCRLLRKPFRETVEKPRAFLIMTAMNLIRDKYRADQRQNRRGHVTLELVSDMDLMCPEPSAESHLLSREAVEATLDALTDLSPKCQAVFVMKLCYGYSYREIAEEMDISSVVGVKKHMMRALGHLRNSAAIEEIRTGYETANDLSDSDLPGSSLRGSGLSMSGYETNGVVRQVPQAAD